MMHRVPDSTDDAEPVERPPPNDGTDGSADSRRERQDGVEDRPRDPAQPDEREGASP